MRSEAGGAYQFSFWLPQVGVERDVSVRTLSQGITVSRVTVPRGAAIGCTDPFKKVSLHLVLAVQKKTHILMGAMPGSLTVTRVAFDASENLQPLPQSSRLPVPGIIARCADRRNVRAMTTCCVLGLPDCPSGYSQSRSSEAHRGRRPRGVEAVDSTR